MELNTLTMQCSCAEIGLQEEMGGKGREEEKKSRGIPFISFNAFGHDRVKVFAFPTVVVIEKTRKIMTTMTMILWGYQDIRLITKCSVSTCSRAEGQ